MSYTSPPSIVFAVVDTTTGSLKVGGGSSTKPQSQVHETYQAAQRALGRMRYDKDKYDIYTYELKEHQ